MFRILAVVALTLGLTATLCAQTPSPPAPAAPVPAVPKPTCVKPEYPGRLASERGTHASDTRMRSFNRDIKTYQECMKQYTVDQAALAKAHNDAANAAVDEYNAFVKDIQTQQEANK